MPYANIPGIKSAYIDTGALAVNTQSAQPNMLVIGPASKGRSLVRFNVVQASSAEGEFGRSSPLMRTMHELLAQGADNISLLRVGGYPSRALITDSADNTLAVLPELHGDDTLERYALQITTYDGENRYVVYDLDESQYVYDTAGIHVLPVRPDLNTIGVGPEVRIVDTDFPVGFLLNSSETNPRLWISLFDMVSGDITGTPSTGETIATVAKSVGSDGLSESLIEKYASLVRGYYRLDYKDADYLVPVDVFLDDKNITDAIANSETSGTKTASSASDYGYYWSGPPTAGTARDVLGYVVQYELKGNIYVGFADTSDYYEATGEAVASYSAGGLTVPCLKVGKGGNACTIRITQAGSTSCTLAYNSNGGIDISVAGNLSGGALAASAIATAINTAIAAFDVTTLGPRVVPPSVLLGTATGTGSFISSAIAKTNFTGGVGGAVIYLNDPYTALPSSVSTMFSSGVDAWLREVNFAHQLAEACHLASKDWKATMGVINTRPPLAFDRVSVADWVGELPDYEDNGSELYIASSGDNGYGILGNKFLAGEYGYRGHILEIASSSNGLAYGGLIRTVGSALPNGEKWPYGISEGDEALDESGRPVDIGKFIFISYAWVTHTNAFNGGSTYVGSFAPAFAVIRALKPAYEEPIGAVNGRVRKVSEVLRIHSTQLSQLAGIRAIGTRMEDGIGLIIVSAKTAAHPDSDYTRSSTMLVANRLLDGIRRIARPYIGKAYTSQNILSLQSAVNAFLVSEKGNGVHKGARVAFPNTKRDAILGILNVQLQFVPPGSIESIVVKTSVAADESSL